MLKAPPAVAGGAFSIAGSCYSSHHSSPSPLPDLALLGCLAPPPPDAELPGWPAACWPTPARWPAGASCAAGRVAVAVAVAAVAGEPLVACGAAVTALAGAGPTADCGGPALSASARPGIWPPSSWLICDR